MDPIVNGIKKQYAACMDVKRVNFHQNSEWHELIYPVASPEFALLDAEKNIIYRWFGVFGAEEFIEILDPLCVG